MSLAKGIALTCFTTISIFMWFYIIIYLWCFESLIHASAIGSIVAYAIVFVVLILLSIPMSILFVGCYACGLSEGLS